MSNRFPIDDNITNPFLQSSCSESTTTSGDQANATAIPRQDSDKSDIKSFSLQLNNCSRIRSRNSSNIAIENGKQDHILRASDVSAKELFSLAFQNDEGRQLKRELEPLIANDSMSESIFMSNAVKQSVRALLTSNQHSSQFLTSVNITIANPQIQNLEMSPDDSIEQNVISLGSHPTTPLAESMCSVFPEMLVIRHNSGLTDSTKSSPELTRGFSERSRRFSVDLSQMRSLRLFFNDENCTSGQLVIASRESQFKIMHFHHGGLDHLAQVLHQWHCLLHNVNLVSGKNADFYDFHVITVTIKRLKGHLHFGISTSEFGCMYSSIRNPSGHFVGIC